MNGRRWLRSAAFLALTLTSCTLAYAFAAFLTLQALDLLLAVFTSSELEWIRRSRFLPYPFPRAVALLPPQSSALLFSLQQTSFLVSSLTLLLLGAVLVRRAGGWVRVLLAQTLFWIGALLTFYTALYLGWSGGPLSRAVQILWPAHPTWLWFSVAVSVLLTALIVLPLYVVLRHLLDTAGTSRRNRLLALGGRVLLPGLFVVLILLLQVVFRWSWLPWTVTTVIPASIVLLAAVAGLPAALARARPAAAVRVSGKAALLFGCLITLLLGGMYVAPHLARWAQGKRFRTFDSRSWKLHLDPAAFDHVQPESLAVKADQRLTTLCQRLGFEPPNPRLEAYYYSSADTKRVMVESDEPFTIKGNRSQIHHLLTPAGLLADPRGDALLLMQVTWGEPGSPTVAEAIARYALGDFHGHDLADYAARITREEGPYQLGEILALNHDYLSPLERDALAGSWVELLVERRGQKILPVLYQQQLEAGMEEPFARGLDSSWEALEREWRSYLLAKAATAPSPFSLPRPGRGETGKRSGRSSHWSESPSVFHRGISFSHEVGGNWGYGSDRAQRTLTQIHAIGANAIAVVPYAFTRAPRETRIFFSTDETDARVIRTIEEAQQLGLRVALKPQLWGERFTGDIRFEEASQFQEWFGQYRRWLLHFARLSELYDVELLVIGTELGGVSDHEAAWRALIAEVRRVYHGPLTYAAHWGKEFEELRFWDALDYLGVNMYYPLAGVGETPRRESPQVQALVEKFARLSQRHSKPVLFTEVGYPSSATAAAEPWTENRAALDPDLQARCYETVFAAFYQQTWFGGLYWWKWPSHGRGGRYDPSYNPIGNPAAEVLAKWYQQDSRR